mgnify:CR=1 FL=1
MIPWFAINHINLPAIWLSTAAIPLTFAAGGRVRWPAMYIGGLMLGFFCVSAQAENDLHDRVLAAKLGIIGGVMLAWAPRTRLFPLSMSIPQSVTDVMGTGYVAVHAYRYYDERYRKAEI